MSNTALNSASIKTTSSGAGEVVRELIAAMPIVIFVRAVRAALRRQSGSEGR